MFLWKKERDLGSSRFRAIIIRTSFFPYVRTNYQFVRTVPTVA